MTDTDFYDRQYDQILTSDRTDPTRGVAALQRTVAYTASESTFAGDVATAAALVLLADAAHRRGHQEIADALLHFSSDPREWEQQ